MTALASTMPAETGAIDLVVVTTNGQAALSGVFHQIETTELHTIYDDNAHNRDGEEILTVVKITDADPYDRYLKRKAARLNRQARLALRNEGGVSVKERETGRMARSSARQLKHRAAIRRQLRQQETHQLLASLFELYAAGKKPRERKTTGTQAYLAMSQSVWRRFFKAELAKQLRGQSNDLHAAVNARFRTLAAGMSPRDMRRKLVGIEVVPVKRRRLWQDEAAAQKRKRFVRPDASTAAHDDISVWHEVSIIDSQEDYAHAVGRCAYAPKCRYITADGREWVVRMRRRSTISDRWIHWIQEQKRVNKAETKKRNRRKPIRVHSHSAYVPECLFGEIPQLMLHEDLVRTTERGWFVGVKEAVPMLQVSHLGVIPAVAANYLADATPLGADAQALVHELGGTIRCYDDNPFIVAAPFAGYNVDEIVRQDQVSHTGAFAFDALAIADHLTAELLRLAKASMIDTLEAPELTTLWQIEDDWVYQLYERARSYRESGIREAAVQFLTKLVDGLNLIALWDRDEEKLDRLIERAEVEPSLADRCEQFYHGLLESDALVANWYTNREKVYRLLETVEQIGDLAAIGKALAFAMRVVKPTKVNPSDFLARNLTPAQGAQVANVYHTLAFSAVVLGATIKARKGEGKALPQEFVNKAEAYAKALLMSKVLPQLAELDQETVMNYMRVLANYGGDLREAAMGFHRAYLAPKQAVA